MSRKIKFRVWDRKKIHNPKLYNFEDVGNDIVLMQYTGLKDKNRKEIYEGDICSFKGGKYEIQYGETLMGFFQKMVPKHTGHFLQNQNMNKCEVIGNIYENPELVQK